MRRWIVLLRGINVSGQKKVIMAELRELLAAHGFSNIKTYIQSGNVILDAEGELKPSDIEKRIASLIKSSYGYEVGVFAFLPEWLQGIVHKNPYLKKANLEPKQLYLAILDQVPQKDNLIRLDSFNVGQDEYHIQGSVIYLRYSNGAGKSKLTNNLLESKLKVRATSRNWNTVMKLLELSR